MTYQTAWNNETALDPLGVTVKVVDDDTGKGSAGQTVEIHNVDPQLIVEKVAEVPDTEPGKIKEVYVEGKIIEVGIKDLHKVTLIWGDGFQQSVVTDTRQFSFVRSLSGDIAWVSEDLYPLVVKLIDDDLGPDEKTLPRLNINISRGQGGPVVPDKDEVKIGSFTVANLNDTDGDGVDDFADNSVVVSPKGIDEVDLMRLDIDKPTPYTGGDVVLTVAGGFCPSCGSSISQFWNSPTKGTSLPLDGSNSIRLGDWENVDKKNRLGGSRHTK